MTDREKASKALSRLLRIKLQELDWHPRAFAQFIGMHEDHLRKVYNGQVIVGTSGARVICEGLSLPYDATMKAFGWDVTELNGGVVKSALQLPN